jgi:hypothetical protein
VQGQHGNILVLTEDRSNQMSCSSVEQTERQNICPDSVVEIEGYVPVRTVYGMYRLKAGSEGCRCIHSSKLFVTMQRTACMLVCFPHTTTSHQDKRLAEYFPDQYHCSIRGYHR